MTANLQTIKDIRLYLMHELAEMYEEQEINALTGIMIKTVFGLTRLHQHTMSGQGITAQQAERLIDICTQLKTGKPIQYILGDTIFYDCVIKVNQYTLIPRPETEELADLIIKENKMYSGHIIDFGTGSGCIAIALAANIKGSSVTGIDISGEAVRTAQENALINNVSVSFIEGDILHPAMWKTMTAGIIVSNPPYVRESEKQYMNKNVLDFEPFNALFVPDSDPLVFYRAVLEIASEVLNPGGKIYFEINEALGEPMIKLLELRGYSGIEILKDLNGKERIIKGTKNG
jgi:release factor glutamine methyltransferase